MRRASESWFLTTLLTRLTVTIGGLKTDSLLRLHELLDWGSGDGGSSGPYPPTDPAWGNVVGLVEEELARRKVPVSPIRREAPALAEHR